MSQKQMEVGAARGVGGAMKEGFMEPFRMMGLGSKTLWGKARWRCFLGLMILGLACLPVLFYDMMGLETTQDSVEVVSVKNTEGSLMGYIVQPQIELRILEGPQSGKIVERLVDGAEQYMAGQHLTMEYKVGRLTENVILVDLVENNPQH